MAADDDQGQDTGDGEGAVSRAEFEGLEGKVDKVLGLLEGQGGSDDDPVAPSIADQVRAGIDELEARKARDAEAKAAADREADRERRLAALEEQPPGPPETWLGRLQRRLYGQEPDGSATPPRPRQRAAQ